MPVFATTFLSSCLPVADVMRLICVDNALNMFKPIAIAMFTFAQSNSLHLRPNNA